MCLAGLQVALFDGELVDAFVFGVAGVSFDPVEVDGVGGAELVECFPEFAVFDGLFGGGFPAFFLPVVDPFREAFEDVLAVGVEVDGGGFVECG